MIIKLREFVNKNGVNQKAISLIRGVPSRSVHGGASAWRCSRAEALESHSGENREIYL